MTASGKGSRGSFSSPTAVGSSDFVPFFPLARSLLSDSTGICGETRLAVLTFRDTEGFFLYKFTVENNEKLKAKANRGQGSSLHVGLCHDV